MRDIDRITAKGVTWRSLIEQLQKVPHGSHWYSYCTRCHMAVIDI